MSYRCREIARGTARHRPRPVLFGAFPTEGATVELARPCGYARVNWFSRPRGGVPEIAQGHRSRLWGGPSRPEPKSGALGLERKHLTPCKGVPTLWPCV